MTHFKFKNTTVHETQEGLVFLYLHIANIQYSKQNEPFQVLKHYV